MSSLIFGLVFSVVIAYRIGRQHSTSDVQAWYGTVPIAGFSPAVAMVLLRLHIG